MRAAITLETGPPSVIKIKEAPIPQIKQGWVLIKVKAFGLNRSELFEVSHSAFIRQRRKSHFSIISIDRFSNMRIY